jgi:hypothetical protein
MKSTKEKARSAPPMTLQAVAPTRVVGRLPEWIRLPKGGSSCPWTGLSRSKLNELVLPCESNRFKPPVKSSVLRQRGALKGVRLIHLDSLLRFIEAHVQKTESH